MTMHLYRRPDAERRAVRQQGGLDYEAVEAKPNGLFVGNVCVHDESYGESDPWPRWVAPYGPLRLSPRARLHKCGCGAFFIAHWSARVCLACRKAETLAKVRAYTAERAKLRAERRANPPTGKCQNCGKPTPALRSTRRFCSAACRQAESRWRRANAP